MNESTNEPGNTSIATDLPGVAHLETILLSAFLESIQEHVYFKDQQSRFIAISKAKADCDGKKPEEYVGKTDFDFMSEDCARLSFADEQNIITTGQPILEKLEKEVWNTGKISWMLTSKMPLRDQSGKIIGTYGVSRDVTEQVNTQQALEASNRQLMEATRQAGMAEVATGVLHNVGNVLTSINVTANLVSDRCRDSKVTSIFKVCALLRDNSADLGSFFSKDPRAAKLPIYLESLANNLDKERVDTMNDLSTLLKSIDHVKDIIWMQQSYASVAGMVEPIIPAETIDDAIKLSTNALQRHNVQVERQIAQTPPARAERHKVLQILVNLISNAKKAMDSKEPSQRRLLVRVENGPGETVVIKVVDNGIGIPPENLTKVFSHGFTTRKDGHGFGLHSSALAAKQMGGELTAGSEGVGAGATFTLILPRWKEMPPCLASSASPPTDGLKIKSPEECFTPDKSA